MSGTHGVFQHRSGYFFTILEEDFCEMYRSEGVNEVCRAYITSILENLTNKQFDETGCDEDIWVYMSLPEMARRMRNACSARTIHKEIQGMIKDGYLKKRRAIGKATMEYCLNAHKIRNGLASLPEKQSCNSATSYLANLQDTNVAELQDQSGKSARLILQNYKNDLANLQPRIRNRETREETENKEDTVVSSALATATAPTSSLSEEEYQKLPYPNTPSEALAYLKPHGPLPENMIDNPGEIVFLARKLWIEAHPPTTEALPPNDTPSQQGQASGDVTQVPTKPDSALTERCQEIQSKIDELRGFKLNKRGAIINERAVIRKHLAPDASFTDERLGVIHHYITNFYWNYKSPSDRGKVGAQVMWEEAPNVLHILATQDGEDTRIDGKEATNGKYSPVKSDGPQHTPEVQAWLDKLDGLTGVMPRTALQDVARA